MKNWKISEILGAVLGLILVILFAFYTANKLELISGFPKGVDAYAHLTRIAWILTRFPQIHWNPSWDSGTFFWTWSYPPISSILSTILVKLAGISITASMTAVSFASMLVFFIGMYLLLSSFLGVWLAIPVSALMISTPAMWSWWGHGGNYVRIFGLATYSISMLLLARFLKNPRKLTYFFLIISMLLSMTSHMLSAGLLIASVIGYILFAEEEGLINKFLLILKTVGVATLLSSFWYLPVFTSTSGGRFIEFVIGNPVPWRNVFMIDPQYPYFSLPTVFFIFSILVIFISLLIVWKKRRDLRLTWALIPAFLIGSILALVYPLLGNFSWYPEKGYIAVFAPFAMFPIYIIFITIVTAGVLGILLHKLKSSWIAITISLVATLLLGVNVFLTNFSKFVVYDMTKDNQMQPRAINAVKSLPLDQNYRFGTDSAFVSDWFNYFYPDLPQTRDYIYQGIPYKNWQYLQELTIWAKDDVAKETAWLMDWYGIKFFTVGFASPETKSQKFLENSLDYNLKFENREDNFYIFENKNALPILTAVNSPAILIIADSTDYEVFVRNLVHLGWGSEQVIPVWGGNNPADVGSNTLNNFSSIILYRTDTLKLTEDAKLKKYVESGGNLFIEEKHYEEKLFLPSWYPVKSLSQFEVKNGWNFDYIHQALGLFTDDVMSKAKFGDDNWKLLEGVLNAGSETLLADSGKAIVIRKNLGKGKIIWSGMNLPYHAETYNNEVEQKLLMSLIGISESQKFSSNFVQLRKNEPHHRVWQMNDVSRGLVWKETWFPRWDVYLKDSQNKKQKLSAYMAGPALSYIPIPADSKYPLTIYADYKLSLIDYLGWGITLVSGFALLIYLILGKSIKINSHTLEHWWNKDESY